MFDIATCHRPCVLLLSLRLPRKPFQNFPAGRKAEGAGLAKQILSFSASSSVYLFSTFLFQFVVVRRAEQQQLHFRFVLFFAWMAKAGAPPFVVVFFLYAVRLVFWNKREFKTTICSSRFCLFFCHRACHGGGFLGKLVFRLLLSFAACGPCEKGRKSEEKVDFRINVISAALSEGSLSNLSAFLCFRQCSFVKNSLRVCGCVCHKAASSPPLCRSLPGCSFLLSSRS